MSINNRTITSPSASDHRGTRAENDYKVKEPFLKRPFDIFFSSLMIILSLPFSVLFAFAIKLEDGGPVLYRQKRWGRYGIHFMGYKFRTMVPNSDQDYGIRPAEEDDPRITKVGRLLRAMGLDELPQIINIFLGQMSFVGPRPLAVGEVLLDQAGRFLNYEDVPGFWDKLRVRPGLTSIGTIYIPKDSAPERKFRYDLVYIRKQSFWLDVRLILLSFWISFRGKWETRGGKT